MNHTLWTIGYSTHTITRFIELLNFYSIKEVWDVRSKPYSKYNKIFNKECIEKYLTENKIAYSFKGHSLGGRINNPACYDENKKLQYKKVAKLIAFQSALNQIEDKLKTSNLALMCSEGHPLKCHRMILVCRELSQQTRILGEQIKHILPDGSTKTNKEMEKVLMDKFKLYPDMFRTEEECIEGAYNQQAQKIAYTYKESSSVIIGLKQKSSEDFVDVIREVHPMYTDRI